MNGKENFTEPNESSNESESEPQVDTEDSEPKVSRTRKIADASSSKKKAVVRSKGKKSLKRSKVNRNNGSSEKEKVDRSDSDEGESSSVNAVDKDNYEVEKIIDFGVEDGIKYFLIRWKGYDASVDSWEKERSLNCAELIESFYETFFEEELKSIFHPTVKENPNLCCTSYFTECSKNIQKLFSFYDKHPEARISIAKRKRINDSDFAVSSNDSDVDLATMKRYGLDKETDSTSDEESSESEEEFEEQEAKEKRSVGRPKNPATKVSVSTTKRLIGRPRKYDPNGDEDEENYEVEKIIDFGFEDGIKYFLIRWKGCDSSVDSWEQFRSLNCTELIAKFYEEHPEAQCGATKRKHRKQSVDSSSDYDPTDYDERPIKNSKSIKKRGRKVNDSRNDSSSNDSESNCAKSTKINSKSVPKTGKKTKVERKSARQINVVSSYKNSTDSESEESEYTEPEVEVRRSFGRNAMANVSASKKRPVGRPKKNGHRKEVSSKSKSVPKTSKKTKVERKSGRQINGMSSKKNRVNTDSESESEESEYSEPAVEAKRSFGRNAMANVSVSKKRPVGRPKKNGHRTDIGNRKVSSKKPPVKKSVGRPKKQRAENVSLVDKKSVGRPKRNKHESESSPEDVIKNRRVRRSSDNPQEQSEDLSSSDESHEVIIS